MELIYKSVEELIPYINNPRNNDNAVDAVASSIKNFGFKVPIVIDKDNEIINGHTRLKAAKKLGLEEVPCIVADDLTEQQIKAFRLADNKVSEIATWDFELLESELAELSDFDMSEFGFDISEFDNEDSQEVVEDNFEIELPEESIAKYGDIFQLGNHRLMCGDSTKEEDVQKLMDGKIANMCFTDPPYLMNFTGGVNPDGTKSQNSKFGKIKNDNMSEEEGQQFLIDIIKQIKNVVSGAYYICFYRLGLNYLFSALSYNDLKYRALIIWDKPGGTLSNSDYKSRYEPILYGWVKEHKFYGGKDGWDIWTINKVLKNDLHPTMKPLELCAKAIKNSSEINGIILDLFGGSGSTLIASEQLNRVCFSMELDPKYCDVIIKRWEEFTGQKAVKIN